MGIGPAVNVVCGFVEVDVVGLGGGVDVTGCRGQALPLTYNPVTAPPVSLTLIASVCDPGPRTVERVVNP